MGCYESFKLAVSTALATQLSADDLSSVLHALDVVAHDYTFEQKSTSLTTPNTIPDEFKLFLASKAVEEKSPGTLKTYRAFLTPFFKFVSKPVPEISTNDIRVYLYHCKQDKNYKVSTMETVRRIINGFFDFCQTEDIILRNPCKKIKPIKCEKSPHKAMKPVELEHLRDACSDLREKALVDFLYSTGCRVSELCHVKLSDIDWERKSVVIRCGKGKVTRITFLNPESEVSLKNYLSSRASESPYVFAKIHGTSIEPLVPETIQRTVRRIAERSKEVITHVTPHVFRHTVATTALTNGMPVEQVQRFLGHANINTTMIYAEVSAEEVRHSHQKYVT